MGTAVAKSVATCCCCISFISVLWGDLGRSGEWASQEPKQTDDKLMRSDLCPKSSEVPNLWIQNIQSFPSKFALSIIVYNAQMKKSPSIQSEARSVRVGQHVGPAWCPRWDLG